ncbi:MAG: hypothetical protein CL613_00885 [Aquimarina sp.]|nr:hypothetical protein [Aquimarina sp.]
MENQLSPSFYIFLKNNIVSDIENDHYGSVLSTIDWEQEAQRCISSLVNFFKNVNLSWLKENGIDEIGVIDICWNEYGSNIEVDFMPDNNFETAFDDGCIINDSAIDNDTFFKKYFDTDGENSWEIMGNDYLLIITIFEYIIIDIIDVVVNEKAFKSLPKKSPYHIAFAGSHDEERIKIYTGI